jgi:hypothetical protein
MTKASDPNAETDDIDRQLAEDRRRLDQLGKDAGKLEREAKPVPVKPAPFDGGVI